jgi:hypothetical protein
MQIESATLINIMPPTRAPQLREDHPLGTLEVLRVDGDHAAGSDRNRSAKDDLHQTFVESCGKELEAKDIGLVDSLGHVPVLGD